MNNFRIKSKFIRKKNPCEMVGVGLSAVNLKAMWQIYRDFILNGRP